MNILIIFALIVLVAFFRSALKETTNSGYKIPPLQAARINRSLKRSNIKVRI